MTAAMLGAMELRHLRYFVAVAEALSFTKAAQKLRLAQPSLTRQVRNLEEEIGVPLLDRAKNPIVLTRAGAVFLADAKKILAQCAETVATVQRLHGGESTQLNIGYVAHIHHPLLPATLGAFRKLWPAVALNLFDLSSAEQFLALESRGIDVGFVGLRPESSGPPLLFECVTHDAMFLLVSTGHPLATKAKVSLEDLASQFFISMSAKTHPGTREWLLQVCRAAGFPAKILQEVNSEANALRSVADGLGVALKPAQITALPHEGVIFRPLSPPLLRESHIAWRSDHLSKPLRDYLQIVKDLSRSL